MAVDQAPASAQSCLFRSAAERSTTSTPDAILAAAERLFAENGISSVSNRRIAEEAGAANNFAVGYHFGSKEGLVLALGRRPIPAMERWRTAAAEELEGTSDPRGYVAALVRQFPAHLATLTPPTYLARFSLQTVTDPVYREVAMRESDTQAEVALRQGLLKSLRGNDLGITKEVLEARSDALGYLVPQVCAEHERLGWQSRFGSWDEVADFLVDIGCGLMLAPVSQRSRAAPRSGRAATGRKT